MAEHMYTVSGMTCGHCVSSVKSEVGSLAGVEDVSVDLGSGRVTVVGEGYTEDQVRAAVAAAGYSLVDA